MQREGNRKGPTSSNSEHEGPKTPDPKVISLLLLVYTFYKHYKQNKNKNSIKECSIFVMIVIIFKQTLRRLAQNREAARKSRLRKKVSPWS